MNAVTLFTITEAWAAGAAGGGAHDVDIFNLTFPLINFLIFLYIIKRLVVPRLRIHVSDRRAKILGAIQSAAEEKAKAVALVHDYRERMDQLEDTTREIRDGLRTEAEREKDKLMRDARELGDKLRADVQFLTEQEQKIAKQQLRMDIARLARDAAQRTIQANLKTTDQDLLVDRFLQQIEAIR